MFKHNIYRVILTFNFTTLTDYYLFYNFCFPKRYFKIKFNIFLEFIFKLIAKKNFGTKQNLLMIIL